MLRQGRGRGRMLPCSFDDRPTTGRGRELEPRRCEPCFEGFPFRPVDPPCGIRRDGPSRCRPVAAIASATSWLTQIRSRPLGEIPVKLGALAVLPNTLKEVNRPGLGPSARPFSARKRQSRPARRSTDHATPVRMFVLRQGSAVDTRRPERLAFAGPPTLLAATCFPERNPRFVRQARQPSGALVEAHWACIGRDSHVKRA